MRSPLGRPQWIVVLALLATAAAISAGCGGSDSSASQASVPTCEHVKAKKPYIASYNTPKQIVKRGEKLVAMVGTSCGAFRIALDTERAPKTVNAFASLARKGFYEGFAFDRIAPGFMVQGGDPLGTGTNASGPGFSTEEKPPPDTTYTKGVVAMAKRPSDPSGYSRSQFFIVLAPDAELPPEYALIGKVDRGFDVVERIGEFGDRSGKPKKHIVIEWIWAKKPTQKEEESSAVQVPPSLL
jgi:peptidyl-prolyl cis-trans isomerase B (cyclophilin B)